MGARPTINKKYLLLYFPLALLQWTFYTLVFSCIGGIFLWAIGIPILIGHLVMLDKDEAKAALVIVLWPITIPIQWWIDYFTKGEIGLYN